MSGVETEVQSCWDLDGRVQSPVSSGERSGVQPTHPRGRAEPVRPVLGQPRPKHWTPAQCVELGTPSAGPGVQPLCPTSADVRAAVPGPRAKPLRLERALSPAEMENGSSPRA